MHNGTGTTLFHHISCDLPSGVKTWLRGGNQPVKKKPALSLTPEAHHSLVTVITPNVARVHACAYPGLPTRHPRGPSILRGTHPASVPPLRPASCQLHRSREQRLILPHATRRRESRCRVGWPRARNGPCVALSCSCAPVPQQVTRQPLLSSVCSGAPATRADPGSGPRTSARESDVGLWRGGRMLTGRWEEAPVLLGVPV
jgi:hypothetical protein